MATIPTCPKSRPMQNRAVYQGQTNLQELQQDQRNRMSMSYAGVNPMQQVGAQGRNSHAIPASYDGMLPCPRYGPSHIYGGTYQGMSPPNTPPWYVEGVQLGMASISSVRSRSATPNIGTNAMASNMPHPKGTQPATPIRLVSRTPSHHPIASSPGQIQRGKQCDVSPERVSAYSNAQKLRGRLGSSNPAVMGDPTMGCDDLSIEIAMRGRQHV